MGRWDFRMPFLHLRGTRKRGAEYMSFKYWTDKYQQTSIINITITTARINIILPEYLFSSHGLSSQNPARNDKIRAAILPSTTPLKLPHLSKLPTFMPKIPAIKDGGTLSPFLCKFLFHPHYTKSHLTSQSFPGRRYKAGDRLTTNP